MFCLVELFVFILYCLPVVCSFFKFCLFDVVLISFDYFKFKCCWWANVLTASINAILYWYWSIISPLCVIVDKFKYRNHWNCLRNSDAIRQSVSLLSVVKQFLLFITNADAYLFAPTFRFSGVFLVFPFYFGSFFFLI